TVRSPLRSSWAARRGPTPGRKRSGVRRSGAAVCFGRAPVLYRAGVSHDTDRFQGACMAQRCDICGKGTSVGHTISHAHMLRTRPWLPNLVSMREDVAATTARLRVCTRCIKAGNVSKVIYAQAQTGGADADSRS